MRGNLRRLASPFAQGIKLLRCTDSICFYLCSCLCLAFNRPYAWWCHAFPGNIKTRLGGGDFAGIQEEYSTYRTCRLEIALMQDDVTKFPQRQSEAWWGSEPGCLSIFHFVEFPRDIYSNYIPLEFPRNLHHQVSFWCYQKKRDITHKGYYYFASPFILLDEDVLIHPRFQGLFPTPQGPGNEDGADRVYATQKQGTPIVFLLNIYLFSRAMFCIYMLILRASFAMHKISCTMQHNDPRNEL